MSTDSTNPAENLAEAAPPPLPWYRDTYAVALTMAFFLANLWTVLHHAMWRDEWHVWQLARFAPTFGELYERAAHFGRPVGWYVLTWAVNKLGFYPTNIKLLHVLVSTACMFLIVRYAPFSRLQKLLLVFGYFPFYEYGTIMRDYSLGLLTLVIACIAFTARPRRPIAFGAALAIAFQTTTYVITLGLVLAAVYLFDAYWNRREETAKPKRSAYVVGVAIALVSLAVAFVSMRPTADLRAIMGDAIPTSSFVSRIPTGVRFLWKAYCPMMDHGNWNTNFLDGRPGLEKVLAVCLFLFVVRLMWPRPSAVIYYVAATATVGAWLSYLPWDNSRYHGHYFMVLIISYWIYHAGRGDWRMPQVRWRSLTAWEKPRSDLLTAVLGIHVLVSVIAVTHEVLFPFSGSHIAANVIRFKAPPDVPVIGDCDYAIGSVAADLGRAAYIAWRKEYYAFTDTPDPRRREGHGTSAMPRDELLDTVRDFVAAERRDVVLVVNYPLVIEDDDLADDDPEYELIGITPPSIEPDEQYVIYLVKYDSQSEDAK